MKRAVPWDDNETNNSSSSDESSSSNSEAEDGPPNSKLKKLSQAKSGKQKGNALDFEALKRHGYKGGLSVLNVPPPKEKPDWSWSTGRENSEIREAKESFEDRQKTRAAILDAEELANVQSRKEKQNVSFSQKEKRKRELGQVSRGKNYVEEEKRLLRDSGIYSGFDT
ncbi:selenocysteine methyltransferase-like isoform X1 [Hibiscus syriacus]|uniref:Selenocysteine methyltransferase-like isoform X1 n=1 Tax=Hibiscus syriacus TaxID=106335 RepID=A0A6A2Z575_HIBSY|nr:uncharacterized protein LOC120150359 [Hibiscus syriacus]KAE8687161.1 selenocysteine methyltransferase-like isoform X1 [Hibiscus syriacus]